MRYELSDNEWGIIRAMLPTKPRGIPRVDNRRVQRGSQFSQVPAFHGLHVQPACDQYHLNASVSLLLA